METQLGLPADLDGRAWVYSADRSQDRFPPHRHRELEINLVIRGSASYLVRDRVRVAMQPRTLLWLFPAQDHVLLDRSDDFQMWIAVFTPELVDRACTTAQTRVLKSSDPGQVLCRRIARSDLHRLESLYGEIEASRREGQIARHNAGLGYALLSTWSAHAAAGERPEAADVHPAVERAAALLRDDRADLSVDDIARRCGLSASRLSRLFRQQTGLGIIDYRNQRRIDRFFALYRAGRRINMIDAALQAGFGSYPQFHRVFKRMVGHGPAEHRRLVRTQTTEQRRAQ